MAPFLMGMMASAASGKGPNDGFIMDSNTYSAPTHGLQTQYMPTDNQPSITAQTTATPAPAPQAATPPHIMSGQHMPLQRPIEPSVDPKKVVQKKKSPFSIGNILEALIGSRFGQS